MAVVTVLSAAVFWISASGTAYADVCTWTGAGADNLWSTAGNWSCDGGHLTPQNADSVAFPAPTNHAINVNDVDDLELAAVSITGGVGHKWQISGNAIIVSSVLSITTVSGFEPELLTPIAAGGTLTIGVLGIGTVTLGAVHLGADTTIDVAGSAELRVNGAITSAPGTSLIKQGPGVLTLSSPANDLVFIAIDAGVLRAGAAGALPDSAAFAVSGTLDLNGFDETINSLFGPGAIALGGKTLTVIQNVPATFDGVITGTGGGLTKAGAARLTLGGAASNTYTGATTVTAGELRLLKTANAQTFAGPLVINGGSVTADFGAQISDSTAVTVNAPGVLSMSGGAGSVEAIGSLAGSGTVTLTDHTLSVGFNNLSTVFSGTIGGNSAFLSKHGTGTLTLTGINDSLDGTVFMSGGGGLIVNGAIASSLNFQGALLGGAGAVGNVPASTGVGTIAPGPGPGGAGTGILSTLSLALGGAMTLSIDVNGAAPGAGYDRLAVANQVLLGNAYPSAHARLHAGREHPVHDHRQRERQRRRWRVQWPAAEFAAIRRRPPVPHFVHRRRRQRRRADRARAAGVLDQRHHRDRG